MAELDIQGILGRLDAAAVDHIVIRQGEAELWSTLSAGAVTVDLDGVAMKVIGYEDLVALKEQAGRPADLEDLERLRRARGE